MLMILSCSLKIIKTPKSCITQWKDANAHDDLRQDGQRPLWKEILTVYAVKTTTDPENSLDAVSMDEEHAEVLLSLIHI